MNKVLLIWEEVPDNVKVFELDESSELHTLAVASAGKYINGDDLENDHAIFKLNAMLEDKVVEPVRQRDDGESNLIFNGPYSQVIICGFFL